MAIQSNKSVGTSMFNRTATHSAKSVSNDLSTIENIKVRKQIRNQQKAIMMGRAEEASKAARTLNLSSRAENKAIKPLIRKRTAREFAND